MSSEKTKYLPEYTYDDYKNWEGKWELINGIPYAMSPAPRIEHQEVSLNIAVQLKSLLRNCKKCKTLQTVDWRITGESDDNVLQPDNLVISKEAKGNYITESPELIFEILSPSTSLKDRHVKYEIYESHGVRYYVIVDIDLKSAEVFELQNNKYIKKTEAKNDKVKFELDKDCSIDFDFSIIWV